MVVIAIVVVVVGAVVVEVVLEVVGAIVVVVVVVVDGSTSVVVVVVVGASVVAGAVVVVVPSVVGGTVVVGCGRSLRLHQATRSTGAPNVMVVSFIVEPSPIVCEPPPGKKPTTYRIGKFGTHTDAVGGKMSSYHET